MSEPAVEIHQLYGTLDETEHAIKRVDRLRAFGSGSVRCVIKLS